MHEGKFSTLVDPGMSVLAAKLSGTAVAPAAIASAKPAAEPVASATLAAGQTWRDPTTGMDFVWVPGGSFEMGCGSWNRDCDDGREKPAHQVTLGGFWLGRTEVTVGAFRRFATQASYVTEAERSSGCFAFTGGKWEQQADKSWKNPGFSQEDEHPVACISWNDAQAFLQWLSRQSNSRFRLPTDAEWEYACRAGGREQVYAWGNADPAAAGGKVANLADRSAQRQYSQMTAIAGYDDGYVHASPVASFPPNGLGLFDMSGNVFEWVQDAYAPYSGAAATNPVNESGARRVARGGGWGYNARYARCSFRDHLSPSDGGTLLGFRLARNG